LTREINKQILFVKRSEKVKNNHYDENPEISEVANAAKQFITCKIERNL
jgi:hypothetical protein